MSEITQTTTSRPFFYAVDIVTPVWAYVKGAGNMINPQRTRAIHSFMPTDTGGTTEQWGTWLTNGNFTVDLKFNHADTVHTDLLALVDTNAQFLVHAYDDDTAVLADQFLAQLTDVVDGGTDGGVNVKSLVLTPNGTVNHAATIVPIP